MKQIETIIKATNRIVNIRLDVPMRRILINNLTIGHLKIRTLDSLKLQPAIKIQRQGIKTQVKIKATSIITPIPIGDILKTQNDLFLELVKEEKEKIVRNLKQNKEGTAFYKKNFPDQLANSQRYINPLLLIAIVVLPLIIMCILLLLLKSN